MRGHVDEQTLAAFREGLLPARKAARLTAHLATCQRCAEVDAQLAAVTTILARTPAPPMPASLAARLDAALAAEIARSAAAAPSAAASPDGAAFPAAAASPAGAPAAGAASPAGAPLPAGTAAPAGAPGPGERAGRRDRTAAGRDTAGRRAGPGRAPWRFPLRLATAAAAVVLLAGGGYAVVHVLSAGQTGASSSASGPGASRSAISRPAASGQAPKAALGVPTVGGLPLVASGTYYRPGQLPAQVSAVLKRYPAPVRPPGAGKAGPTPPTTAFPHLAVCVAHVAGSERPRLVDLAHYGTRPAAVIVVPVRGTAKVNVWVVGPGCPAQGSGVITHFSMPAPG